MSLRKQRLLAATALVLLLCCGAARPAAGVGSACSTAKQCLTLGLSLYNNDDITDSAARMLEAAIAKSSGSGPEAEQALYYLASYYQRKYYIQRYKFSRGGGDLSPLWEARGKYEEYIDKYSTRGSGEWLADAHFNLALTYAQLNKRAEAVEFLNRMSRAARRDGKVYVYQIVWSRSPSDVVDANLTASSLAEYARTPLGTGQPFEQTVAMLRRWCQSQKSRKA